MYALKLKNHQIPKVILPENIVRIVSGPTLISAVGLLLKKNSFNNTTAKSS